jgi:hypothetical protein
LDIYNKDKISLKLPSLLYEQDKAHIYGAIGEISR